MLHCTDARLMGFPGKSVNDGERVPELGLVSSPCIWYNERTYEKNTN
jgi:hypothetical protein